MNGGISGIQYTGRTGWVNSVTVQFDGEGSDSKGNPDDNSELKVSSNKDGKEIHETIKRVIEAHYGFPFVIVGSRLDFERRDGKMVFKCCVVTEAKGRRLAGNGEAEDMLLAFARACEDAALRIPKLLELGQEMFLGEEVQVSEEERCQAFALP